MTILGERNTYADVSWISDPSKTPHPDSTYSTVPGHKMRHTHSHKCMSLKSSICQLPRFDTMWIMITKHLTVNNNKDRCHG